MTKQSSNNVQIRKAVPADVNSIADLSHKLNLSQKSDTEPSAQGIAKNWNEFSAWVAIDDGKIIGYAAGTDEYLPHMNRWRYVLHALYVEETHRRQNIARELLQTIMDEKSKGETRAISIEVVKFNDPAIALYEGLGFTKGGGYHLKYRLNL